jgi:hypothetical protein
VDDEPAGNLALVPSAFKHGIDEDDILHAYRNAMRRYGPEPDGFTMIVGADNSGRLLEVGAYESEEGPVVIVHAMPARAKYLREW